jgi:hypothetical protein
MSGHHQAICKYLGVDPRLVRVVGLSAGYNSAGVAEAEITLILAKTDALAEIVTRLDHEAAE